MKGAGGRRFFVPPLGRKANKDEDLVLFREFHKRENARIACLLLPVSEEFELTGTNIHPALFRIPSNKNTSSGLQSLSDANKNDYDWLKTPPATPLFPSLEMEAATAPEMAVQKELPIMQPLSRFSLIQVAPKSNPKTPPTNKPKPKSTPAITTTTLSSKPNITKTINIHHHHHSDPFLTSNLSKPEPKSTSRLTKIIRGSVRAMIKDDAPDQTPANLKIEKRYSVSSTGPDPQPLSVRRSRAATVRPSEPRRPEGVVKEMSTHQSFYGSKMVDKVMSARGGDARVGGRGRGRVVATNSNRTSMDIALKPTMDTKGGLRRITITK